MHRRDAAAELLLSTMNHFAVSCTVKLISLVHHGSQLEEAQHDPICLLDC